VDDEILTVNEAAELLKVSPELVLELLLASELAGRNIGGEWRTTKRALVSFVDGAPIQASSSCCSSEMCCTPGARNASGRCCC